MSFRARRLARDIAAAQNASAALQLLRSADVDQIHVTACLHRMASLASSKPPTGGEVQEVLSYMEPEFFTAEMLAINSWSLAKLQKAETEHIEDLRQQLLQLAVERRSEFSARHLSNLLWSAAHCGQEVLTDLANLANELPRHLEDMSPQGLANCFWAISKLAGGGCLQASLLAKALPERAQELKPLDLASIIWSASCFKSAFTPLVDALEARLLQVAFRLSTRQLTNVAWAVATISASRKQRAVEMLVEKAIVVGASERDLPNLCWALAAVRGKACGISETVQGLKQPPTLGMIWALSVTGSDGAGPLLMAGVSKGHYDALLLDPDASQLAQLLWCQATAAGTGSKLLIAAAERVEEFSSLDLSRCAWAAAMLESPAAAHLALRAAEVLQVETFVASATLAQVTWSLTRLQLFIPRLLERLTTLRGCELRTQDLALGVWVLAFWHFVGDRCLLDEMSTDLSDFGTQDLANVAWAMAVQLVTSEPLVVALAVEAERKLAAMAPQHLCNLIWAFATVSWSTREPGDRSNLILSLSKEVRQRSCELENLGLAAASWGFAMAVGGGPLGCGP